MPEVSQPPTPRLRSPEVATWSSGALAKEGGTITYTPGKQGQSRSGFVHKPDIFNFQVYIRAAIGNVLISQCISFVKFMTFEHVLRNIRLEKAALLPYFLVPHVYLLSRWETFMPLKMLGTIMD